MQSWLPYFIPWNWTWTEVDFRHCWFHICTAFKQTLHHSTIVVSIINWYHREDLDILRMSRVSFLCCRDFYILRCCKCWTGWVLDSFYFSPWNNTNSYDLGYLCHFGWNNRIMSASHELPCPGYHSRNQSRIISDLIVQMVDLYWPSSPTMNSTCQSSGWPIQ